MREYHREQLADGIIIYRGDARQIVPELGRGDIVADPPYGIRYRPGLGGRRGGSLSGGATKKRDWGSNPVLGDDVDFDPEFLLKAAARFRILWGANNYANRLPNRGGWLFWDKYCAPSSLSFAEGEFAWTDLDITPRAFRHLWNGVCRASESGEERRHPTQKPIALMGWCLRLLPPSDDPVIDPFMGSGPTGVAAIKAGRKFIGIEIDDQHFETARTRLRAALDQSDLFAKTAVT